jgi:hypothetical protein
MTRPRIFMDAGGWYLAYYLGMWEYILSEFGKDVFKGVSFYGISAGSHASGYIIAAIYGNSTMRYWLDNGVKHVVYLDKYGNGKFTEGLYESGYKYYHILDEAQRKAVKKHLNVFCTNKNRELYCCKKISSCDESGKAASGTGNIPIIGSYGPTNFRGEQLWDGAFYNKYDSVINTKNMLYISFGPHFQCDQTLDLSNWIPHNLFFSTIPSFLPQNITLFICDELFDRGYNDAKRNRDELVSKFNAIGIKVK